MKLTKIFKSKKQESTSLQSSSLSSTDSSSGSSTSSLSQSGRRVDHGRPPPHQQTFFRKLTRKSASLSKQPSKTSMEVNISSFKSEVTSSFKSGVTRTQSLPLVHHQVEVVPASALVRELTEVFKVFDVNNDGRISAVELGNVLRALGDTLSDEELERMVAEYDRDGDGHIDLEEFIAINSPAEEDNTQESLEAAFHVFDSDRNGRISPIELHRVISGLGDNITLEECRKIISSVDKDGDGQVDFEEFQCMMKTNAVF